MCLNLARAVLQILCNHGRGLAGAFFRDSKSGARVLSPPEPRHTMADGCCHMHLPSVRVSDLSSSSLSFAWFPLHFPTSAPANAAHTAPEPPAPSSYRPQRLHTLPILVFPLRSHFHSPKVFLNLHSPIGSQYSSRHNFLNTRLLRPHGPTP